MASILQIAQDAADICAVQRPTNLFNSSIQNDQLFASVVKSTLSSLMRHAEWQAITREGVLYTSEGQREYLISNIVPDFHSLVNGTLYIRDNMRFVIGAISEERWAREKQFHTPEIDILFKIQNNKIKFLKDPGCLKLHFTYKSNAVCYDAKTEEPKPQITENSDIPVFDEYLVKLGIIWRWNKRTGMDYTEEYNEYQRELSKSYAESKAAGDIRLDSHYGIFDDSDGVMVNVNVSGQPCC
jgi:hypothetical protein